MTDSFSANLNLEKTNSKKPPLVSIIVPVYQVSDYVEQCLASVIAQTYPAIECILVDDASPDDSVEKCQRMIDHYQGSIVFRILHHEFNRGLSAARNTGIDSAAGDYLFFLDSDDEITQDCIEKLVTFVLEDDSLELVQGAFLRKDGSSNVPGKSGTVIINNNEEAREQYLYWRHLNYTVWNKLLKKSFVLENKLYNKEGLLFEDLLWTFCLIKCLGKARLCEDLTYYYHIHPGSISTSGNLQLLGQNYAVVFAEILHNLTPGKEAEELKGYVPTYSVILAQYRRSAPELAPVTSMYKDMARHFGCRKEYIILSSVAFASRFCNPYGVLRILDKLPWWVRKRFSALFLVW